VSAFFFTHPEFKSEVTFLPPAEGSTVGAAVMGIPLIGGTSIMYDQVEIIFNSAAVKKRIIEQFNLYKVWHIDRYPAKFEIALKRIKKYVEFKTTVKGSMGFEKIVSYTVSCYHPSADTARLMCNFAFTLIDSSVKDLSTGLAHRNRKFVEEHLFNHKRILDSLQMAFEQFQLANKAFSMPDQMKLSLKTYADIKSSAILNELKMKALQQEFHGALPELEELERNNQLYNQQLLQIESASNLDVMPSLELSARLLPQYSNLARETEVENQVIILLTRELEQARVQEQRNISLLTVIDPPFVPIYKARPHRLLVMLLIFISFHMALFCIYGYQFYFLNVVANNELVRSLLQAIKSNER
jgi:capsule polysaccharide export protein KpsE/RkpR